MFRALGRVIMLPIAFLLAILAALFVIISLGQEHVVQAMTGMRGEDLPIDTALRLFGLAVQLVSVQTLLPAIIGEVARIRGAFYSVVGGGVALAVVPLLTRISQPAGILELSPVVW